MADGLEVEVRDSVAGAIERLEELGARVETVQLPHTEYAVAAYYILVTAEASSNLARYDGVKYGYRTDNNHSRAKKESLEQDVAPRAASDILSFDDDLVNMYRSVRSDGFGLEVKRRIMLGTYVLSAGYYEAYYDKAQRVRTLIKRDFERVFEKIDLLVAPAAPTTAFRIGEKIDILFKCISLMSIPYLSIWLGYQRYPCPVERTRLECR